MLTSMDAVDGAAVADLFAGTGALGVEALSRGAASAVLVDSGRAAVDTIKANLDVLDDPDAATVVCADVLRWLDTLPPAERGGPRWDIVFADPPYAWARWGELVARLASRAGVLVAETGAELDLGAGWEVARSRRYGTTLVTVAIPRHLPQEGAADGAAPDRARHYRHAEDDLRTAPVPGGWRDGGEA